jgi:heat shock protein beta
MKQPCEYPIRSQPAALDFSSVAGFHYKNIITFIHARLDMVFSSPFEFRSLIFPSPLPGSVFLSCSDADTPSFRPGAETMPFQAEVNRLMDIIVHSLYSNKDIFLRELISNAADALDKVRFLSLTDASALGEGAAKELPLGIQISVDKEKGILSLRDTGVGMTKTDLINNLGTIARSGTAAFLEQMQKSGDLNLIGQFGVGFYSVYLVSDYVEVITKHSSDKQWVWESTASGQFAISEDVNGESLGRGTMINIHLKKEAKEYMQESKLKELVARYSEFINFPISLQVEKTVEKEVPLDEAELEAANAAAAAEKEKKQADSDDSSDDAVEEEESEDAAAEDILPKTKKITEVVQEWEVLNDSQALWLRPPGEVSDEEYEKFYKVLVKSENEAPLAHSHFRAEGDVDFKAVMYLPSSAPPDMYDQYYTKKPRVKLYVRRVFISDSFEELLPKWLSFLVGLVDSDSMPLNVSREMLQMAEGVKVIRKKLVRKVIEMIKKLSDAEEKVREGDGDSNGKGGWFGKKAGKEDAAKSATEKYTKFWKLFGKAIKMGIIEDTANRKRLMPLLRFRTSSSGTNQTSLDAYISRMKPKQTGIYYLVGTGGVEELEQSPFVEALVSKGFEVIYFTDALDEYVMGHVNEYDDKKFINVSKDDLKLEETDEEKAKEKRAAAHYKGLATWWKGAIGDTSISSVKTSRRLSSAPCVVVSGKYGWTATMERIARAQALSDSEQATFMRGQRTLEINPRHPLIRELRSRWEDNPDDSQLKKNAKLLYESCLMESGFLLDDTKSHNEAVMHLLGSALGIDGDLKSPLEEEEYPEIPVEEEKKGGKSGMSDGMGGFDQAKLEEMMEQMKANNNEAGNGNGDDDGVHLKDEL